ncbi:MAG: RHS repeat-associated core domain-containing protein [Lentimicrobium sp.]|nr:RHS repeat-associated core domain-containing protein [Lentimicrobium sp.]
MKRGYPITKRTDFISNFVIINNAPAWINFDEGRVLINKEGVYFTETHLKDHLGNTRVAIGRSNNALEVKQVNSFYPFGMNIKGLTTSYNMPVTKAYPPNEYLYNGKMFQDELGLDWLDYGARMYDAVLGRWHVVDPLAEKGRKWSPYIYCANNPLKFIDPDGQWPWEAKNVRDARKEGRRADVKPEIWRGEDGKKWASVEYKSDQNKTGGAFAKVFKPEGKSWKEAYDSSIGEFVKDGSNDLANRGGTTKEGWEGALKIVGTIATAGTLLEAEGFVAITSAVISTLNTVDDLCNNAQGEGLIEQNISNPETKGVVKAFKSSISTIFGIKGVKNYNKTIQSPFETGSTLNDLNSTYEDVIN